MKCRLLSRLLRVEEVSWLTQEEQKTYSDLLDIAIDTDDKELREASLIQIKRMGFNYINNNNPLGYMIIADWNTLQGQTDNALTNYLKAANSGIPKALRLFEDYRLKAESSAGACILLAEAYFLNGNDNEGIRYLKKCMDLGCGGVEAVLKMHSKGSFRTLNSFDEIGSQAGDFKWRVSESITLDYQNLEKRNQEKVVNFCCGFAIAKGASVEVNRDESIVCLSHSYMERILVKLPEGKCSGKVLLLIKEPRDLDAAIRYLSDGICTTVDFSECRTELAQNIFDTLGGYLFGITGEINRLSDNEFEYIPMMRKSNGTEPEVWSHHQSLND